MDYPLQGAFAKVERAKRDLDSLEHAVRDFLDADAYRFVADERNPDTGRIVARLKIDKPLDFDWGVDLGVIGFLARSALDHLVYQLALANGSDPEKDRTQFPIFESADDYFKGRKKSYRNRMLAGVAEPHRTIIDGYQPFHATRGVGTHPLALLRWLTDADKHRYVPPALAAFDRLKVNFDPPILVAGPAPMNSFELRPNEAWVLEDNDVLTEVGVPAGETPKLKLDSETPLQVAFGERRLTFEVMRRITRHVEGILGRFSPVFGPSAGSTR